MAQVVEIYPREKEGHVYIHSRYYGFWWPGHARRQNISNHRIGLDA